MNPDDHLRIVLRAMKKRQMSAYDEERHLRVAQIYVDGRLRKALQGVSLESIDIASSSIGCDIRVLINFKSDMQKVLERLKLGDKVQRMDPRSVGHRASFQFKQGMLKGMISLDIRTVSPVLPILHEPAATPQKQEN